MGAEAKESDAFVCKTAQVLAPAATLSGFGASQERLDVLEDLLSNAVFTVKAPAGLLDQHLSSAYHLKFITHHPPERRLTTAPLTRQPCQYHHV